MKIVEFNARCPFEIGDKVKDGGTGKVKTITDIVCMHHVKSGRVEFFFELNNSGNLVKIITADFLNECKVESTVAHNYRLRRFTQRTEAGVSLILDNPKNDIEAAEQVKRKFQGALKVLADFEDLGVTPGVMARADVKEVCNIICKYQISAADFIAIAEFCGETALHNDGLLRFLQFALKEYHKRA